MGRSSRRDARARREQGARHLTRAFVVVGAIVVAFAGCAAPAASPPRASVLAVTVDSDPDATMWDQVSPVVRRHKRDGDGDRDHDGIVDRRDRCPDEAEDKDGFEDRDGCPDDDNDDDGVLDTADRCPDDAESFNDFEDEDGCPDTAP